MQVIRRREMLVDGGLAAVAFVMDGFLWAGRNQTRFGGRFPVDVIAALGVTVALALLGRRRWPVAAFASSWLLGLVPIALPGHQPFVGLLISLYTVASARPIRVARAALVLSVVPLGINTYNTLYLSSAPSIAGTVAVGGIWTLVGSSAWGVGRYRYLVHDRTARREREHALESAAAVEVERRRLARELHDIVSHSVGAMTVQAGVTRVLASQDRPLLEALRGIESTGQQAMRELHRLLGVLRSDSPERRGPPVRSGEGLDALDRMINTTRECGVEVDLVVGEGSQRLDPSIDHAAYRVLQEGLANVVKHGGPGVRAQVCLEWQPGTLRIEIRNDLPLGDPPGWEHGGFGLLGIGERIGLVGGTFQSGLDGSQFAIEATVPLQAPEALPCPTMHDQTS